MFGYWMLRLKGDTGGATAVEYGLLLALMAMALIGAITALGTGTADTLNAAANGFNN